MVWTADREEQMVALRAAGSSAANVAARLGGGLSKNAVIGRLHRLNRNVASAGGRPDVEAKRATQRRTDMSKLADAFAAGAPTLGDAAIRAGVTYERAGELWRAIKTSLGWQAQ